jgi:hypothetical protein
MLETRRLKIYAASQDIMEQFIEAQTVDVLKAAYTEMLNGCLEHPDQWEWYAIWMIELKDGTYRRTLLQGAFCGRRCRDRIRYQ